MDFLSSGERTGKSSNLKAGVHRRPRCSLEKRVRVGPRTSLLEQSAVEGDSPLHAVDPRCFVTRSQRVELFGNAAPNGW